MQNNENFNLNNESNENSESSNIDLNNNDLDNNDLEYNDGLGDLLREKEKHVFSWKKTGILSVIFLAVIGIWLTILLNTGKNITSNEGIISHPKPTDIESSVSLKESDIDNEKLDDLQKKLAKIEKENLELIGEIDDILEDNTNEDNKTKIARMNLNSKEKTKQKNLTKKQIKTQSESIAIKLNTQKNNKNQTIKRPTNKNKTFTKTSSNLYRIIVGSFKNMNNAKKRQSELSQKNIKSLIISTSINNQVFFRIQAGSFKSKKNATSYVARLKEKGIKSYIISE